MNRQQLEHAAIVSIYAQMVIHQSINLPLAKQRAKELADFIFDPQPPVPEVVPIPPEPEEQAVPEKLFKEQIGSKEAAWDLHLVGNARRYITISEAHEMAPKWSSEQLVDEFAALGWFLDEQQVFRKP
jgi:hypothetical protein